MDRINHLIINSNIIQVEVEIAAICRSQKLIMHPRLTNIFTYTHFFYISQMKASDTAPGQDIHISRGCSLERYIPLFDF